MYIGKYSAAQLLQASVMDKEKVRFGFFGAVLATVLLFLGKGLSILFAADMTAAGVIGMLGSVAFGLVLSVTILGITASVHSGFSAKKSRAGMFKMGMEKILPFIGVLFLFALATLIILAVEYGIYLIGGAVGFGPVVLGIATPFLLVLNFIAIFVLAVGTKLLPAYLVSEKGSIVDAAKTLSVRVYKNMPGIVANIGLLIVSVVPCITLLSALMYGTFMSVVMVDRLVLQQAFFRDRKSVV